MDDQLLSLLKWIFLKRGFRARVRNPTHPAMSRFLTSVFDCEILAYLGLDKELQAHQIDQELAPKVNHPAPGIFHVACSGLLENAFVNVVRDLVA